MPSPPSFSTGQIFFGVAAVDFPSSGCLSFNLHFFEGNTYYSTAAVLVAQLMTGAAFPIVGTCVEQITLTLVWANVLLQTKLQLSFNN